MFKICRNQTSDFPICLPTALQNQCLDMHIGQWYYQHLSLSCQDNRASHYSHNLHSARLISPGSLPRSTYKPRQPQSGPWFIPFPAALIAQQTCSGVSGPDLGSKAPILTMAWIVVFLKVLYSRTVESYKGESWKEPSSYLPLVLLIAQPSQS